MTSGSALESQTNLKSSIQDSNKITNHNDPVIQAKDLKKVYLVGKQPVFALNGVSFEIERGEFCAIVGTSGSGKSTLLNLLAGLEPPSKGNIIINQKSIIGLSENKLVNFRRDHVGFIFQSFNLIPNMSAWENVALPLIFRGTPVAERKKIAIKMLDQLGLKTHIYHKPNELSGGQQQRVGIARALVVNPAIVFADEPTGNLDSVTSSEIMLLMQQISKDNNQTLIMVTHDDYLAQYADRIFRISDGKIIGIEKGSQNEQ
ncbi:MAG: ABC transporter ATP-binding protein [Clostridiaceae bacterium]|jgi:putative ABC transport system ATP-binding protein|nr:ABC transporter ATP-binding protein [Clostridiaceae bacterium]